MSVDEIVLLGDETPVAELIELQPLIAEAQERGVIRFSELESCLEEIEVTKEQVQELHAYLDEQGIAVIGADGRLASSEESRVEATAPAGDDRDEDGATGGVVTWLEYGLAMSAAWNHSRSIGPTA